MAAGAGSAPALYVVISCSAVPTPTSISNYTSPTCNECSPVVIPVLILLPLRALTQAIRSLQLYKRYARLQQHCGFKLYNFRLSDNTDHSQYKSGTQVDCCQGTAVLIAMILATSFEEPHGSQALRISSRSSGYNPSTQTHHGTSIFLRPVSMRFPTAFMSMLHPKFRLPAHHASDYHRLCCV